MPRMTIPRPLTRVRQLIGECEYSPHDGKALCQPTAARERPGSASFAASGPVTAINRT